MSVLTAAELQRYDHTMQVHEARQQTQMKAANAVRKIINKAKGWCFESWWDGSLSLSPRTTSILMSLPRVQALQEFRRVQQPRHSRREFDINDPHSLTKSEAIRLGDEDPRLGVSSLQVFQGEVCPAPN